MEPYARPKEPNVGARRPKIQHVAETGEERRTRSERQADKEGVVAQRRAIKKSARQHLKQQLAKEANDIL